MSGEKIIFKNQYGTPIDILRISQTDKFNRDYRTFSKEMLQRLATKRLTEYSLNENEDAMDSKTTFVFSKYSDL